MIVYSDKWWMRKCAARYSKVRDFYHRDTADSEQRCTQRVATVTGSHVSLPTLTSSQTDSALDPETNNKDLTDDVPCVSLRSQRVLARSVKT